MKVKKGLQVCLTILCFVWLLLGAEAMLYAADCTENHTQGTASCADSVKQGLIREQGTYCYYANGKKVKNVWKKIKDVQYYFKGNGKAAVGSAKIKGIYYVFDRKGRLKDYSSDRVLTVNGNVYCVTEKSQADPGWHLYKNRLYYAKKNGKCAVNKTIDGISLNAKGYAPANAGIYSLAKAEALKTLEKITSDAMTTDQKRRACWDYLMNKTIFTYYPKYPDFSERGWQRKHAWDMLYTHSGNCYSFACAFAALAHEIGDHTEVIVGSVFDGLSGRFTPHCWVRINGTYYDPEAKYAGWADIYARELYSKRNRIDQPVKY